ncbi:hypothetical protein scyTo_0019692 [Scyliorhinus torazame]|uniref:Uncharacterized protein n=1 Tax=Scyliorhinus torazame TaxID=75743 RepID=A0A401PPH5_SCYTO|nr:hypothetical protein [Scyliorhinus torazame]
MPGQVSSHSALIFSLSIAGGICSWVTLREGTYSGSPIDASDTVDYPELTLDGSGSGFPIDDPELHSGMEVDPGGKPTGSNVEVPKKMPTYAICPVVLLLAAKLLVLLGIVLYFRRK